MKQCRNCLIQFEITDADSSFYKKIGVPEPTLCPDCRIQRRAAHRNERSLYKRKCDVCNAETVSVFPPDSEYTVYCNDCWWGDRWDMMDYGMDFDFSRPFFEQFDALQKKVPHYALFQDGSSENSDYINFGISNKNCYLSVCVNCEDVYYCDEMVNSKSCVNCQKSVSCELCYDSVDCTGCYHLFFSQDCINCSDSCFLKDCVGCTNCFCSVGLKNTQYCFCNKKLSKEEYMKKVEGIAFTHEMIRKWKKERDNISLTVPKKYYHGNGNEQVSGDYLDNCRNLQNCFDCIGLEDSAYCVFGGMQTRHIYDCTNTGIGSELCYEIDGASNYHNCKSVFYGRSLRDCEYCKYCFSSEFLFGCIGLSHKKYCIFNTQYAEKDFFSLKRKIIAHMKETGEYSEYFPVEISPYGYNETKAQDYYPLTKEEAIAKGYQWRDKDTIINDVTADNCRICEDCGAKYKVIDRESAFYERFKLPVPLHCPECRNRARRSMRNPRKLWDRACMKCEKPIKTSYAPNRPERVYCEECYLQEVY